MSTFLKENKKQTLLAWKTATPISVVRETILSLMYEWQQASEDTADAEGLQKIDEMTEKQWMEECEALVVMGRRVVPYGTASVRGHGRGDVQFSSVS